MMGFLAELKRRKLVQWALAYAAGAWVALQAIGFLVESYEWSHTVSHVAISIAAIGFVATLVLAWYHGERGDQGVSGAELALLAAIAVGGATVAWWATPAPRPADAGMARAAAAGSALPTIDRDPSIAVLPFVNMSDDKGNEYFSDGISEELLNLLAKVPRLRVIARTSSFAFKGKEADIADIAHKLNVAAVLEGSVRKSGDKVRITVQLIRSVDSSHLWSENYDRTLDDIFRVQDEIAASVVDQLKIKMLGAAPTAKPVDREAYALFLQAREVSRQGTTAAFEQSIALYQQALARDPGYAAAWVGLATFYCTQEYQLQRPAEEAIPLARAAIDKALAIDPDYAPAHALLGWIEIFYTRDLAAAAGHIEHALSRDPANPDVLSSAAILARRLLRFEQAIAIGQYLLTRDPVSATGLDDLGYAYVYAGRRAEGVAAFRTVLRLSPGFAGEHYNIAILLLDQGDAQAAMAEALQETDAQFRLYALAAAYHGVDDKAKSDEMLAEAIERYGTRSAYNIGLVITYRGEDDRAFEWLERSVQQREPDLGAIPAYPTFARLHADPRWLPLLRKAGIAPEQLAPIEFKVTLPEQGLTP